MKRGRRVELTSSPSDTAAGKTSGRAGVGGRADVVDQCV